MKIGRTLCLVAVIVILCCTVCSCTKRLGGKTSNGSGGGASAGNSTHNNTSINDVSQHTETVPTKGITVNNDSASSTQEISDVYIRISGMNIYINDEILEGEYSKSLLSSKIKNIYQPGMSVLLDDETGDYDLSKNIRKDLQELGYEYAEVSKGE